MEPMWQCFIYLHSCVIVNSCLKWNTFIGYQHHSTNIGTALEQKYYSLSKRFYSNFYLNSLENLLHLSCHDDHWTLLKLKYSSFFYYLYVYSLYSNRARASCFIVIVSGHHWLDTGHETSILQIVIDFQFLWCRPLINNNHRSNKHSNIVKLRSRSCPP